MERSPYKSEAGIASASPTQDFSGPLEPWAKTKEVPQGTGRDENPATAPGEEL